MERNTPDMGQMINSLNSSGLQVRRGYAVIEFANDGPVYVIDFATVGTHVLKGNITRTVERLDASSFADGPFKRAIAGREQVTFSLTGPGEIRRFATLADYELRPDGDLVAALDRRIKTINVLRARLGAAVAALNLWPRTCRRHPTVPRDNCTRCIRIEAAKRVRESEARHAAGGEPPVVSLKWEHN